MYSLIDISTLFICIYYTYLFVSITQSLIKIPIVMKLAQPKMKGW